jgi:P-type Cu+ transporter
MRPASDTPITLDLGGMSCAACVRRITSAITAVPGVADARVDLVGRRARVIPVSGQHTDVTAAVVAAITSAGYTATPATPEHPSDQAAQQEVIHLRRSVAWAVLATLPVLALAMGHHLLAPGLAAWSGPIQGLLSAVVIAGPGRPILAAAWRSVRHRSADMNTLITLGALVAWTASLVDLLRTWGTRTPPTMVFWEAAAVIITAVLIGRLLETGARRHLADAVAGLAALQPDQAQRLDGDQETTVPARDLQPGDRVRVRPGDRFPADGVIEHGRTAIDAALVTGESLPADAAPGDPVQAGTLNRTGAVDVRLTAVGAAASIGRIVAAVAAAQSARAPIARLADRVSAIFVPVVLGIALLTLIVWVMSVPGPAGWSQGIFHAVAVLVIACPCALGLATPAAIAVGTGRAAQLGILIRGGAAIEAASRIDLVLLDKTGTLTTGEPQVVAIEPLGGMTVDALLQLAARAEVGSEHPVGRAVVQAARQRGMALDGTPSATVEPGAGITAQVGSQTVVIGTVAWLERLGVPTDGLAALADAQAQAGRTPLAVAIDGRAAGVLAVQDAPTPAARVAVQELHQLGIAVALVTGDRVEIAAAVARELGIATVHAGVRPEGKAAIVAAAQREGHRVAMVGDGLNDAPALAGADLGVAVDTGTAVAQAAADMVLAQGGIARLPTALHLARSTYRAIRQNLAWAFAFNVLGIPVAAGVLVPIIGWSLPPMLASAAMALSSTAVLLNALRLRRAMHRPALPVGRTPEVLQTGSRP